MNNIRGLMWFREDLRIDDNTALHQAATQCALGVVGVFIIDTEMWRKHSIAPCRIEFQLRALRSLQDLLQDIQIPLLIIEAKKSRDIPRTLHAVIEQVQAQALFINKQYEVNELQRDKKVEDYLTKKSIRFYSFDDQTILPPFSVTTLQGKPFSIFTAYKNAWYRAWMKAPIKLSAKIKTLARQTIAASLIPTQVEGFQSAIPASLWPAEHRYAEKKLKHFIQKEIGSYDKTRDFPALNKTSRLSPYLASGVISPRRCFLAALMANENQLSEGNKGHVTWMTELIWRDFYKHILIHVPRVSKNQAYKLETEQLNWQYDSSLLLAWQTGQTGFPIIDAAMRQLNQTGWMHNRLRMLVAMFLSKNLFLDWRLGESYFMSHLIDGDLSANNGGWQWSASTGTDAVPYFRLFNPVTQSMRYDPAGQFIREYCPELAKLDDKSIHHPYQFNSDLAKKCYYPEPIINLSLSRKRVLAAFKTLNKKSR